MDTIGCNYDGHDGNFYGYVDDQYYGILAMAITTVAMTSEAVNILVEL